MIAGLLGIKPHDRVGIYAALNHIYTDGKLDAVKTKDFVLDLTFERAEDGEILQDDVDDPPYDLPEELNAMYNGARGSVCL